MSRDRLRLRVIALVAAYAVALQGLLAAFSPVAAAWPAGVLCSGQSMDEPVAPVSHEPSCTNACVMLGAAAAPPPPQVVIAETFAAAVQDVPLFPAPPVGAPKGLQTARAPPFV